MRKVTVQVDAGKTIGPLEHNWRHIGYDECNYTYIPEGVELLKKFAALGDGPYHVRTHFMFCTGNCHGTYKFGSTNLYTEDADGTPVYDFEYFDKVIDAYMATGSKPFIELGFMPHDLVDWSYLPPIEGIRWRYAQYREKGWTCPPKDYEKWRELIRVLLRHMIERYGREEVTGWYFELWNEPDHIYWEGTTAEYCKLYDYTEAALREVLPEGRLAGPAVTGPKKGQYSEQFMDDFLAHCRGGVNYVTGATGTRLDYITYHVKGGGFPFRVRAPKETPSVKKLLRETRRGLDLVKKHGYGNLEVVLSEADPDGWAAGGIHDNANMKFRNTEYYASYVASSYEKLDAISAEYGIAVKPLAWAFLFPGERCFEGTRTFTTQGIDKAVFNLFKIYGKLGNEKYACASDGAARFDYADENDFDNPLREADVGAFAAKGAKGEVQILVYSHHDDWDKTGTSEIHVTVTGLQDGAKYVVTHHRIDAAHSNACREWEALGRPIYPTPEEHAKIKAASSLEEFQAPETLSASGGTISLTFDAPAHAVSFITLEKAN